MPRPFTRAQVNQNRAFLAALARTGNARLAAGALGVHRSTYTKRRARCADFATRWDAALVVAHAALRKPGAVRAAGPFRTEGGEPVIVKLKSGRWQLRRALPGRISRDAEQAFLRALAASANVRLSAAAAGFTHSSFYTRRRKRPAFAREMRLALRMGYERLEAAAVAASLPEAREHDAWRNNDPLPIPPMSPDQALQLLFLHEKSVHQSWEKPHRRRRRGESDEVHAARLAAMWRAEKAIEAEEGRVRQALRDEDEDEATERPGEWRWRDEPLPELPALAQVRGWSKASGKPPYHEGVALFGGWRIRDMERKMKSGG